MRLQTLVQTPRVNCDSRPLNSVSGSRAGRTVTLCARAASALKYLELNGTPASPARRYPAVGVVVREFVRERAAVHQYRDRHRSGYNSDACSRKKGRRQRRACVDAKHA